MGTDDMLAHSIVSHMATKPEYDTFAKGLNGMINEAAGKGHFRPTQDAFYWIFFNAFGPQHWIQALAFFYMLLHGAGCLLLAHILRRMGAPAGFAFLVAALFAVHPSLDTNFASVQYGNNTPGTAFIIAACAAWIPRMENSRRTKIWQAIISMVLLLMGCGFGINLAVSGPMIVGLLGFYGFRSTSAHWRDLFIRAGVLVTTVGLFLLHRYRIQGKLGSKIPAYEDMAPSDYNILRFLEGFFNSTVLLVPTSMTKYFRKLSPVGSGANESDFGADISSLEGLITAFAAAAVIFVLALLIPRRENTDNKDASSKRYGIIVASAFAGGLGVTHLVPYFVFIGRCTLNRYNQPATVIVCTLAVMGAWFVASIILRGDRARYRSIAAGLLVLPIFVLFIGTSRESARSTVEGHRIAHTIIKTVADDIRDEPNIHHFYVAGFPRIVGRAGFTATTQPKLESIVSLEIGRILGRTLDVASVADGKRSWVQDIGPHDLVPDGYALFQSFERGRRIERVYAGSTLEGVGLLEKKLLDGNSINLKKNDGVRKRLMSDNVKNINATLVFLDEVEGRERVYNLRNAFNAYAKDVKRDGKSAFQGGALGERNLILRSMQMLSAHKKSDEAAAAGILAVSAYPDDIEIAEAVLQIGHNRVPKSAKMILFLALFGPEKTVIPAVSIAAKGRRDPIAIGKAVFQYRQAWPRLFIEEEHRAAAEEISAAIKVFSNAKLPATIFRANGARARIAFGDAKLREREIAKWTKWTKLPIADQIQLWDERKERKDVVSLTGRWLEGLEKGHAFALEIGNSGTLPIAGGRVPQALRLRWSTRDEAGRELKNGLIWLSDKGLGPGRARRAVVSFESIDFSQLIIEPVEYDGSRIETDAPKIALGNNDEDS